MADSQPPVQPRQDPNFRDLRPADQIIANPMEGHDYSYHPQAQAIQQGLAMKRINAGQSVGGMRIGAPSVVHQPVGGVGVANAYAQPSMPEAGRQYSPAEASKLSVPKGWGSGEITIGGQTTHMYSDPAATQAHADRVAAQSRDEARAREHAEHLGMLRDISNQMGAMTNEYYGGRMSAEDLAGMHAAMSQHAGNLLANDAAVHTAELQRQHHFDPRENPAFMQATINQMNASAEHDRADAANKDPMRKLDLLDALGRDPNRRALALAMGGADPATISALPAIAPQGQHVTAANSGQLLEQDRNRALNELLGNKEMPLDQLFTQVSGFPGFADRHSETRQLFDDEMRKRFAGSPDEWAKQWYVPPKPTGGPVGNFFQTLGARLINLPAKGLGLGVPGTVGGSLFDGQRDYDAAVRRVGLMSKYGINPYGPVGPIGVNKES